MHLLPGDTVTAASPHRCRTEPGNVHGQAKLVSFGEYSPDGTLLTRGPLRLLGSIKNQEVVSAASRLCAAGAMCDGLTPGPAHKRNQRWARVRCARAGEQLDELVVHPFVHLCGPLEDLLEGLESCSVLDLTRCMCVYRELICQTRSLTTA